MAFEDSIRALSAKAKAQASVLLTEEAAKTALVMPFINALGYDVFDPHEVVPEFIADVGVKKGEKVDYAIRKNDEFIILIECKPTSVALGPDHLSQLYRYFSVTKARFALLTNGINYQFYTDLEESNKLDQRPFLVFDLIEAKPNLIPEIKKFSKENFDVDAILSTASTLKYLASLKTAIQAEFDAPSEGLVRLLVPKVYEGRITAAVRDEFGVLIRSAYREIISETVTQRLSTALAQSEEPTAVQPSLLAAAATEPEIETTPDEIDAFLIVKSIVRRVIAPDRIFTRDQKSYCAILVDDNNRRPVARLHFNKTSKYIGLFDGENEEKIKIDSLDDIFGFSDRLVATIQKYPSKAASKSDAEAAS